MTRPLPDESDDPIAAAGYPGIELFGYREAEGIDVEHWLQARWSGWLYGLAANLLWQRRLCLAVLADHPAVAEMEHSFQALADREDGSLNRSQWRGLEAALRNVPLPAGTEADPARCHWLAGYFDGFEASLEWPRQTFPDFAWMREWERAGPAGRRLPLVLGIVLAGNRVVEVLPGGPAARAGMTAGMRIVAIDGRAVAWEDGVRRALVQCRSGQVLQVGVEVEAQAQAPAADPRAAAPPLRRQLAVVPVASSGLAVDAAAWL